MPASGQRQTRPKPHRLSDGQGLFLAHTSERRNDLAAVRTRVANAWHEFKRKEWADETYRKTEFVLREYLTPALRIKPISMLSTARVKPGFETIAVKALHLASKACWYLGGIVSYPNSLVTQHRCLKGMEAGAEMCTFDEAVPYFL